MALLELLIVDDLVLSWFGAAPKSSHRTSRQRTLLYPTLRQEIINNRH